MPAIDQARGPATEVRMGDFDEYLAEAVALATRINQRLSERLSERIPRPPQDLVDAAGEPPLLVVPTA